MQKIRSLRALWLFLVAYFEHQPNADIKVRIGICARLSRLRSGNHIGWPLFDRAIRQLEETFWADARSTSPFLASRNPNWPWFWPNTRTGAKQRAQACALLAAMCPEPREAQMPSASRPTGSR